MENIDNLLHDELDEIVILGQATELTQGMGGMWPEHGGREEFRGS